MGTVTGTTQDKLHLVKTYDPTQPYIVGRNGVTAVYTDVDGVDHVEYTIDGINYHTRLIKNIKTVGREPGNNSWNLNNPTNLTKSYKPNSKNDRVRTSRDTVYPTTFNYTTQPYSGMTSYFIFKDEVKMGVVFTPKVEEEVFIERQSISIYEPQTRLGEILSLEGLVNYNNGFYNVTKTE